MRVHSPTMRYGETSFFLFLFFEMGLRDLTLYLCHIKIGRRNR